MTSIDPWVDNLTIETPEQTALEYSLAGIGSRFLALVLDSLFQYGAMVVLFLGFLIVLPAGALWQGTFTWALAIFILCIFILQFGYFVFFEAIWNGQTPGKRFTRLRVIQDSGRPISAYQAITRNLLRIVDYLPSLYIAGIISMLFSRQNKRLGDYVAGTVVVHEKPFEQAQAVWDSPSLPEREIAARYNVSLLTADELQLIEGFLQRRSSLSLDLRNSMSREIAHRLAEKLGVLPQERPAPEAFLEQLARARRSMAGYR